MKSDIKQVFRANHHINKTVKKLRLLHYSN